jgi:hypothetical protein
MDLKIVFRSIAIKYKMASIIGYTYNIEPRDIDDLVDEYNNNHISVYKTVKEAFEAMKRELEYYNIQYELEIDEENISQLQVDYSAHIGTYDDGFTLTIKSVRWG